MENNNIEYNNEEIVPENVEETNPEVASAPNPSRFDWKKELREWVVAIVTAVILAFFIRTFIFTLVQVSGPSMENTMFTGDRLVVTKLGYEPKQGDIVVLVPDQHPDEPYIKRVIATEGQTVDIDYRNGIVYVDGNVYEEDYIKAPTTAGYDVKFPITVPEDCVFVMGDNRPASHDGRSLDVSSIKTKDVSPDDYYMTYVDEKSGEIKNVPIYYGCVHEDDILGKAQFRLWPLNSFGSLYK